VKIIGLLLRHFILCLDFWWVELQIRFLSAFSCHLVRWQIRLIRFSGLLGVLTFSLQPLALSLLLLAFLPGCASAPKPVASYAPSSAGVLRAVTSAKAHATSLRSEVTTPAGLRTLDELNASLDSSLLEVATYSAKVDTVSLALSQSEASTTYWKAKHSKALKELWIWRGLAALTLASLAGWLSLRMGFKFAL